MTWRTIRRKSLPAGASRRLRAWVRDENLAFLPRAQLSAFTVRLTDQATEAVINGRDGQNILGANGGAVSDRGQLTFWLTPQDTALLDPDATEETRVLAFAWTYGGGKVGRHEYVFTIARG